MTQEVPAPPPAKVRLKVEPEEGGQLEQLLIANKKAHDDATEAGEREGEAKAAIKAWLLSLFPDGAGLPDSFDIVADPHGRYPAYTMTLKGVGSFRLDTELLKTQAPEQYVRFAKPVTPTWELRESTGGRRRK